MNSMSNHPLDPNGQAPIPTPEPTPTPTPEPTPNETTPPAVVTLPSSKVDWKNLLKDKRVLAIAGGLLALGVGLGGIKLMGGKPTPPVAKADTKIEIPEKKPEPTPAKDNSTDPLKLPADLNGPTLKIQPEDDLRFGNERTPKIKPVKNEDPLALPMIPSVPSTPEKDPFKPTTKPMGMGMGDNDPPLLNGRIKITAGGSDNKIPEIPLGPTPGMNDKKDPKDPLTLPMIPSVPDNDKTPKLPDIPTIPGTDKKDPPKLPEIPLIDDKKPELPKIPDSPMGMGGVKLPDLPGMGGVKLPDFPPKKNDDIPGLPMLPKDNDPVKLPPLDPFKPDPKNDPSKIDPIKIDPIKVDPFKDPIKVDPIRVDPIRVDSGSKPVTGGSDFEEDLHVIEGTKNAKRKAMASFVCHPNGFCVNATPAFSGDAKRNLHPLRWGVEVTLNRQASILNLSRRSAKHGLPHFLQATHASMWCKLQRAKP